jgi:hypothetical protein
MRRAQAEWNIEYRTAEYRRVESLCSVFLINLLSLFNKIDRIPYFDIRYSLFDIRYSLFQSFYSDQTGCPLAGGRARMELNQMTDDDGRMTNFFRLPNSAFRLPNSSVLCHLSSDFCLLPSGLLSPINERPQTRDSANFLYCSSAVLRNRIDIL